MKLYNGGNKLTFRIAELRSNFVAVILCVLVTAVLVCLGGCSRADSSGESNSDGSSTGGEVTAGGGTADADRTGNQGASGTGVNADGGNTGAEQPGNQGASGTGVGDDRNNSTGEDAGSQGTEDNKTTANSYFEPLGQGMMKVICFEAGHADSFLLYTDEGVILIDTGEKGFGKKILEYMEKHGLDGIDYMLLTHFDKDHIGGAAKVIRNTRVSTVYTGTFAKDSEEMMNLAAAMNEVDCEREMLMKDISFEIGGMTVEIDTPARMIYEDDPSNNSSLIIRVTHGQNVFLFMADAQNTRIREYLETKPAKCDVLKVPYHGIFQGALPELVTAVKPSYAIITSDKKEKEDAETCDLFKDRGIDIYKTRKGEIEILSDGSEIIINQ